MSVLAGCYIHERPVAGWQVDKIEHVRVGGQEPMWWVQLIRTDGEWVRGASANTMKQAYQSACNAAARKDGRP